MAIVKASFNLNSDDIDTLERLAEERDVSVTYALRQAIADAAFLHDEVTVPGNELIIKKRTFLRSTAYSRVMLGGR